MDEKTQQRQQELPKPQELLKKNQSKRIPAAPNKAIKEVKFKQEPAEYKPKWLHLSLVDKPRKISIANIFGARMAQQNTRDSFHRAVYPILVIAQIFALIPVAGIGAPAPTSLNFKWCSIRVIYSLAFVFSAIAAVVIEFVRASSDALNAKSLGMFDGYLLVLHFETFFLLTCVLHCSNDS